jgi:hypothetical protein
MDFAMGVPVDVLQALPTLTGRGYFYEMVAERDCIGLAMAGSSQVGARPLVKAGGRLGCRS